VAVDHDQLPGLHLTLVCRVSEVQCARLRRVCDKAVPAATKHQWVESVRVAASDLGELRHAGLVARASTRGKEPSAKPGAGTGTSRRSSDGDATIRGQKQTGIDHAQPY
jgi:hypothetical protein